jgi:transcriptional regulator with XRE-family HTH domain
MSAMDRAELATFLRSRRARLQPVEVGLPDAGRRRTPGLRRQEVAQLAGMSIDYYIRLEQGRGPHPSPQILSSLARALLLTADEREYLFCLAGEHQPPRAGPAREITPGIRNLLDSMTDVPAYVVDAAYDVLAWNDLVTHFIGDPSAQPDDDRNMIRWMFTHPLASTHWTDEQHNRFARALVADLRAAYARYPGNPRIAALVAELLAAVPRFADMWAEHQVAVSRAITKRVQHPVGGLLEFECQLLAVPDTDQRLIVYTAEPGSATRHAFRRLAGLTRVGL